MQQAIALKVVLLAEILNPKRHTVLSLGISSKPRATSQI